jgi:hypothetical protein
MLKRGQKWTDDEDDLLRTLMKQFGKQWSAIANQMPNRSATQIAARWEKCINPSLTKGPFTSDEDSLIVAFVAEHGTRSWPKMSLILPQRTAKQCRERWFNNLDPSVTKGIWTPEEDRLIFEAYLKQGPKWAAIAQSVPGRTDNAIKNRWNASISKRIRIDEQGNRVLGPCQTRRYSRRNVEVPKPVVPGETPAVRDDWWAAIELDPTDVQLEAIDMRALSTEETLRADAFQQEFPLSSDEIEVDVFLKIRTL